MRTRFHTCYLQNQSPGFLLRQPIPFNLARESVIHSGLDCITVSTEESVDRITTTKAQKRTSNIVTYLLYPLYTRYTYYLMTHLANRSFFFLMWSAMTTLHIYIYIYISKYNFPSLHKVSHTWCKMAIKSQHIQNMEWELMSTYWLDILF